MGSMLAFNLRAQDVADRTFDHLSYGEGGRVGLGSGRTYERAPQPSTSFARPLVISAGSVWKRKAVEEWAERTGRRVHDGI